MSKILYFYDSSKKGFDLQREKSAAKELGAKPRDAAKYSEGDFIEQCTSVAGAAPKAYTDAYPDAESKSGTKKTKQKVAKNEKATEDQ